MINASSLSNCLSCLPGFYCISDSTLGIIISTCPAGVYCSGGARNSAGNGPCPAGYYCPAQTSKPIPCLPGYYCASTGLNQSEAKCSEGYYCTLGASNSKPQDNIQGNICPQGYYCPTGTSSPLPCPIGTYNAILGATNDTLCLACPNGFLCNQLAATTFSVACPAGYYCPSNNTRFPCPIGYYCPSGR